MRATSVEVSTGPEAPPHSLSRLLAGATILVLAFELFAGIGTFPLQEPDEGRYGDIAATIARTGDWLTPNLNGIAYYEKPPLFFWLAACSVKLLGPTEAAVRLPSCLGSLVTLLLVYALGRRAAGVRTGLLAAVILGSVPLFGLLCRITLVDLVLTACTTTALWTAWSVLVCGRESRRWTLLFWTALALAFLTKGPIGVILPASGIGAFVVWRGEWRRARRLLLSTGPLLFLALVVPWYAFMAVRHPEFLYEFFVEQNFQRLTTGGRFRREKPFYFYAVFLLAVLLPWARAWIGSVRGLLGVAPRERSLREDTRRFLLAAVVLPLLVLSAANSKLPYYLLPLLPPLALLLALALTASPARSPAGYQRWIRVGGALLAPAFLVALWVLRPLEVHLPPLLDTLSSGSISLERALWAARLVERLLPGLTLVCAALGASLVWLSRRAGAGGRDLVWGMGWCLFFALVPWVASAAATILSTKAVALAVEEHRRPGERVLSFGSYPRCVPFYLGEPVTLWNAAHSEFGHQVSREEAGGLALQRDPDALRRFLESSPQTLILVSGSDDEELARRLIGPDLEQIAAAGEYVLLRAPPPEREQDPSSG